MKWPHLTDHISTDAWMILFCLVARTDKPAWLLSLPFVEQSRFLLYPLCLVSHPGIFVQNSTVSPNTFLQVNMNTKTTSRETSRAGLPGVPHRSSITRANSSECWQQSSKNFVLLMLIHILQIYIFNIESFCCSFVVGFPPSQPIEKMK